MRLPPLSAFPSGSGLSGVSSEKLFQSTSTCRAWREISVRRNTGHDFPSSSFPVPCAEKTLNTFLHLDGMAAIESKPIISEVEDYVWQFPGQDFWGISPLIV